MENKKQLTAKDLINFELEVIKKYKKGKTYGPVHLSKGNEKQLIKIFKKIRYQDWVFTTHRSHYHALLKSKDKDWLMNEIIVKAQSSHINSRKYKIFSSSIVGGIIPIALGVALGIKKQEDRGCMWTDLYTKSIKGKRIDCPHVYCFVGDMAAEMGQFYEAVKYAEGEELPITFIIEDNGLGCDTPTRKVWKEKWFIKNFSDKIITYTYERGYPHYGIGEWIIFNNKKLKTKGDYVAEKNE